MVFVLQLHFVMVKTTLRAFITCMLNSKVLRSVDVYSDGSVTRLRCGGWQTVAMPAWYTQCCHTRRTCTIGYPHPTIHVVKDANLTNCAQDTVQREKWEIQTDIRVPSRVEDGCVKCRSIQCHYIMHQ